MPTNFPTSVDNFTNPTANDSLNLPSHSTQHANANDAIEAVEDYLLNGGQGLTHITTQTFTATAGFILSNIFSARYDNYVIHIRMTAVSGSPTLTLQLRTGSTTLSSGYNSQLIYGNSGPFGAARATNAFYSFGQSAGDFTNAMLSGPFLSAPTSYQSTSNQGQFCGLDAGVVGGSTSYESLVIGNTIGGLNSGVVRVYGVRNS